MRQHKRAIGVLLVMSVLVGACAGTLEKSVQVAHVEKQVVEAVSDSFAKLYLDDAISKDVYLRGRTAYGKWSVGQETLAKSLAEWKRVGGKDSSARLTAAMAAAARLADDYLRFVGQFVDIAKVKASLGGR